MPIIDDKVVAMSFESAKFEKGVDNTLSSLDKLKKALHFPNAGKGLDDVNAAAKRVDFGHMGRSIDDIKNRLGALRLVAIAAFAQIAQRAIASGSQVVKSFTIGPLKAGFQEYATNLNAVQTILANTQAAGVGIKEVNHTLKELNEYSDKTIYNFSQMARNIGTFTAAGVDLDTATASIKGIANLAALSGSNAEQASTAMYQLSQAIAAGRVGLQDWNSVVNAGMGGTVFQRALAQTAEAMGTLEKGSVKLEGKMKNVKINGESFRQSMQAGPGKQSWLSGEVLTKTLQQFTSDMSDAELKAQGFTDAQIKAIQQTAKTAMFAATEVKTFAQVLDVARESAGSGWAQTWQIIFGDFAEAKKTFTQLSNAINGFINASADARNKVLGDWKALGGRTVLIEGIKEAFDALGRIIAPIKAEFRGFFPATTGKGLFEFTKRFTALMKRMQPSIETIVALKRTFGGIFAVLDIGVEVVKGVIGVFKDLIGATGAGGGGFLLFTANIGTSLERFHEWLIEGGRLAAFFENLTAVLRVPMVLLGKLAGLIADLFAGFNARLFSGEIDGMTKSLGPLGKVLEYFSDLWGKFVDRIGGTDKIVDMVIGSIVEALQSIGPAIGQAATSMNFEAILSVIRTGLFAALVIMFKNFLGPGSFLQQLTGNNSILGNISGSFEAMRKGAVAMQTNVKADTLKKIATAMLLLAISVLALSFVDPERLKSSLTGIAVAFGQLLAAMAILEKISVGAGFLKMPFITASLIALAIAIDLLSVAVIAMAQLSWEQLAKGLGGVAALLTAVSIAVIPLSANAGGMIRASVGIIAISIAMNLLALAVKQFAAMNLPQLAKGLGAVAVGLGVIALAMKGMPVSMVLTGPALIAVAIALNILAKAVSAMGALDLKTIGRGLLGIAGALIIIAGAMHLMPKFMLAKAAGLFIVALALKQIAKALAAMGRMSVKQIAKSLATLAGSLVILAGALHLMKGTLGGSLALATAAAGLALLAPALVLLGKQSWQNIFKSLITLAGALTVIGIAGALVGPAVPALIGLGVALTLIGGGLALAGAGIFLISAGISALAISGPTGIAIMYTALEEFANAIPTFVKNIILGLLEIVEGLARVAPRFVEALVKIVSMLLEVVIKAAPKIGAAFAALLTTALKIIKDNAPKVIQAGIDLIVDLLEGIRNNIGKIVTVAVDIVIKFVGALAANARKIVTAGVTFMLEFIQGIADNVYRITDTVADIILKFIRAIGKKSLEIGQAGLGIVIMFLAGIGSRILELIAAGKKLITDVMQGVADAAADILKAARKAAKTFMEALATEIPKFAQDVYDAVILLMNNMADVIGSEKNSKELRKAGFRLGIAIVKGMTLGLLDPAGMVKDAALGLGKKAIGWIGKATGVKSPSVLTKEIGENLVKGMALGMDDHRTVFKSATAMGEGLIKIIKKIFLIKSPSEVMRQLGEFVTQGFAQGIRGGSAEVKGAFGEMSKQLTDAMRTLKEELATEQETLDELMTNKPSKANTEEIIKQTKVVLDLNLALIQAERAQKAWTKSLKNDQYALSVFTKEYERLGDQLERAQEVLTNAKQVREDAIAGFTDQYSTLPDIVSEDAEGNAVNSLATYMKALKDQANAVGAYKTTLDQLRKLGLDDATYQKLLEEGTENQRFASQLLSGGKTAVQALNKLDAQLMTVSKGLATSSANNLYNAGVKAAQGVVKGLTSQRKGIKTAMEAIARDMVAAFKKILKIKSPSQVFAEIGKFAMEGMAQGFQNSSKTMTDAAESATKDALSAIRNIVTDEMNMDPVITPVLDLTQVRKQAEEMTSLTKIAPVTAVAQASMIASGQKTEVPVETPESAAGTVISYEQNNYSPKSLSEVEIYRNTKNTLSQLRTALNIT